MKKYGFLSAGTLSLPLMSLVLSVGANVPDAIAQGTEATILEEVIVTARNRAARLHACG